MWKLFGVIDTRKEHVARVPISVILTEGRGQIGLTECPGRSVPIVQSIAAIVHWNPAVVVTLVEEQEFGMGLKNFRTALASNAISWQHFPIKNYSVPTKDASWAPLSLMLHRVLNDDGRILIHCWGGLGRSGMIAARLLVERGEAPAGAIAKVRAARPGALETEDQMRWAANPQ
jgi:hypothetical protein